MLFELKAVRKRFGEKLALDLPSLELNEGRSVVFYGPNGSGKTTLLNLLAKTEAPTEGTVVFSGGPLDVTLVEQNPYLFKLSLLENVAMGLGYRGILHEEAAARAEPILKKLGLWERRDKPCTGLSDGERRRAALARGLVLGVKALLLDEPMANLDRAYCAVVEEMISAEAGKPGRTVLMATHDLGGAFRLGAEVVYLTDGRLSPVPLWNIFRCEIAAMPDAAVRKALVGPGAEFFVSTSALGPATVSIDPREVLLSFKPIDSSALNCFKGRIASAAVLGLEVDVLIEAGWREGTAVPGGSGPPSSEARAVLRSPEGAGGARGSPLAGGGCRLHAFITPKSYARMNLKPGDEVYATFKASAVKVLDA